MTNRELARSATYIVQHEYEQATVTAADGRQASLGEFYGDPAVALIDADEQWCAVAGEGLVLCRLGQPFGQCAAYFRPPGEVRWITALRQTGAFALEWQDEDGAWHSLVFEAADVSAYAPGR
ncbi:MAG: hypothetical protein I8H79_21515 [Burkholderiales bacterium]|jgi:hypothetical protein|uniref:Uncharacterized protein n=1 Tax=Janthinobacterium tructae TaxID=2590869 RepID=A0A4Y6RK65_9BURK|nr:hypothetical protein [Janthinobacterium tructae]MBH1985134.1 hypothetical protein [Burkholderiales bacterium]MBH1997307.1 hypothetical protein [Burkholderiales bacterium]MBH2071781.1 hypothetical protein [Burkholderiales bacterium]QDG73428.1 hypothetical protein FJQ89_25580 [Janthinobacterium tructae]